MAYGLRLTIEGTGRNERETTVNVYKEGYTDAAVTRSGTLDMLTIKRGKQSGEGEIQAIYGKEATVKFIAENSFEFDDLYTAVSRDIYIEVIEEGIILIAGFIEAEIGGEPNIRPPFEASITMYDMLGMLKDEDFTDANGDEYTGTYTLLAIIQLCLLKTGMTLRLNTAVDDIRETNQAASTSYLTQHSINAEALAGKTCYEILQEICRFGRLQQHNGEWWYISWGNIIGQSFTARYYDAGGTTESGTVAVNMLTTDSWWIIDQASIDRYPALKAQTFSQDFGYIDNILKGGDFTGTYTDYWTVIGSATANIKPLDTKGNLFLYLEGRAATQIYESIEHVGMAIDAGNGSVKLSFKYGLVANNNLKNPLWMRLRHTIAGGTTYYLQQKFDYTNDVLYYEWGIISGEDWPYTFSILGDFASNVQDIQGYTIDEVASNMSDYSLIIPAVPAAGTMQLILYDPVDTSTDILGAAYADVSIEILQNDEDTYSGSQELTITNNKLNNNVPANIELMLGDVPDISNNTIIYKGGLLRLDGTATEGWTMTGSLVTYSYIEILARMHASMQRTTRRIYNMNTGDRNFDLTQVIEDPNTGGRYLIEDGATYTSKTNSISATYAELLTISIDGFTIGYEQNTSASGSSSSGSSGSTTVIVQQTTGDTTVSFTDISGLPTDNDALAAYLNQIGDSSFVDSESRIISGSVIWDEGLTYNASEFLYKILGTYYAATARDITLSAADTTYDRIDVFYLDTYGNINVKEGTPAAAPVEPTLSELQIRVTAAYVAANALVPSGIQVEQIYDEEDVAEWTPTTYEDTGNTTVSTSATADPERGSKHISIDIDVPDSVASLPIHYIGEQYQGGRIFYIDPDSNGKKGLIAAEIDTVTDIFWSRLSGYSTYTTGATGKEIGDGPTNSALMLATPAAAGQAIWWIEELIIDGYDDWFMGSEKEMIQLWKRRYYVGGFAPNKAYWTSTEANWEDARRVDWRYGTVASRDKNNRYNVRAIREFDDTTIPTTNPVDAYTPDDTGIIFSAASEFTVSGGIISFRMKTSAQWRTNSYLLIETYKGAVRTGRCVLSRSTNLFGFNPDNNEDYQLVAIDIYNLAPTADTFDAIKISLTGSWNNNTTTYIDDIRFQYSDTEKAINSNLPAGGDENKVLTKKSANDYDAEWKFVGYDNIDETLKSRVTNNDGTWDMQANAIIQATISTAVTAALTNLQENKAITILLTLASGGSLTLPSYCKLIDGSYDLSSSPDAATYIIDFHCLIADSGSEFVRTSIGKVL